MKLLVILPLLLIMLLLRVAKVRMLTWIFAWWLGMFVAIRYGFVVPVPVSVVKIYMGIVSLALFAYVFTDPDRTEEVRLPLFAFLTEKRFVPILLAIVIAIQAQAGGNLSEALGNLSRVLRDRKRMRAKVSALSMEAKASAAIIGALPFIVAFLVYLTSPNYIMPLFTTSTGHMVLGVSLLWMSVGIFVMKKMMNFDI